MTYVGSQLRVSYIRWWVIDGLREMVGLLLTVYLFVCLLCDAVSSCKDIFDKNM